MRTTLDEQARTIRATITLLEKLVVYYNLDPQARIDGISIEREKLFECLRILYVEGSRNDTWDKHHGLDNLIAALKETNDRLVLSAEKITE